MAKNKNMHKAKKNKNDEFYINFASACRGVIEGEKWFRDRELKLFIFMITEIRIILKTQMKENTFWYKWR